MTTESSLAESLAQLSSTEVTIALMGARGSGKTTFVNRASGSNFRSSPHPLQTSSPQLSPPFHLNGREVTLIDMPGFDDSAGSGMEALLISSHLCRMYENGVKLNGIIYLHRVSDLRPPASTRNFQLFRQLCGDDAMKNIAIVTTHWVDRKRQEYEVLQERLAKLFSPFLRLDAQLLRYENTIESAHTILRSISRNCPVSLLIQRELIEQQMPIFETTVGRGILAGEWVFHREPTDIRVASGSVETGVACISSTSSANDIDDLPSLGSGSSTPDRESKLTSAFEIERFTKLLYRAQHDINKSRADLEAELQKLQWNAGDSSDTAQPDSAEVEGLLMALLKHAKGAYIDASHGIFNDIQGNQINNTNNITNIVHIVDKILGLDPYVSLIWNLPYSGCHLQNDKGRSAAYGLFNIREAESIAINEISSSTLADIQEPQTTNSRPSDFIPTLPPPPSAPAAPIAPPPPPAAPAAPPAVQAPVAHSDDPMEDVDKSVEHRVRSVYPYEGQRPDDLSFGENLILTAHPSKSGGDWWYGTVVRDGKSGFFPQTYVQTLQTVKAKAIYAYTGDNADELPFAEGDELTIVDQSEEDWWKAEQGGVVFIVPAAYLEVEGASLVDKTALDKIPSGERPRQEAIFELIATEATYVRDLQLIVEVFYSSMLTLLDQKAITVIFANIEDILLINTMFLRSLEERQRDCRLYIDNIGDILQSHMSHMGAYMEYCVNQATAIKVLQSLRESNSDLASHLQRLRDDPTVRNLDLSSYLLIPIQRITRYPLLIRQILNHTDMAQDRNALENALDVAGKVLDHINESIREQEGRERLKAISQDLWVGQGRLDLTAPTRHIGPRKLLKEGILFKAKSGRKLRAFLCNDIMVLTDEAASSLYRMPIPLGEVQLKEVANGRDNLTFQVSMAYPPGGNTIVLRATSVRDCQIWMHAIETASRSCRGSETRALQKIRPQTGGSLEDSSV